MQAPHIVSEPSILYFGTPVVLISTVNDDDSINLAPISSAFWLGWRCILGLNATSKTTQNMIRTGECVVNLPSADVVAAVNRLACLTGSDPVPPGKLARGYTHEKSKFAVAELTEVPSLTVAPPRVLECAVQMEAVVAAKHRLMEDDDAVRGAIVTFYGEHVFPLQIAVLLSEPGRDFEGGKFVVTEQRPRMQTRATVLPLRKGDAAVFAVNSRPVKGTRGDYRVALRHGVSRLRAGHRHTLGVIFHDAV